MRGVVGFVYARSCWLFYNLTDMLRKPSACFSLHVVMVPEAYQHDWEPSKVGSVLDTWYGQYPIDTAHIVSINGNPSHRYNIIMKLTKTLQFWYISCGYSNLWHSQWEFWLKEIWPWHKDYHDIKNKHQSIWAKLTPATIFQILYFIIALLITLHIDFPLLGIVSDLLHNLYYCITYCFFIHDVTH
jgi:hypothetical protein